MDKLFMKPAQYNSDCEVQRKRASGEQESCSPRIISSFSDNLVFTAAHEEWFEAYITKRLGREHGCCVADVPDNYASKSLRKDKELRTSTIYINCNALQSNEL